MCNKKLALTIAIGVLVLAGPACVTKKKFKGEVERTEGRFSEVEDSVEANERRIEDLRTSTDRKVAQVEQQATAAMNVGQQAKSTADRAASDADKALKGRLIWSESLNDDRVKFPLNRAVLSDDAKGALDGIVEKIKSYGKAVFVEIEGHTDSSGEEAYNRQLSEDRAASVRDYLHHQGIPLHAMNVIGQGEQDPVAENKTRDGRAQNRRVVIRVLE